MISDLAVGRTAGEQGRTVSVISQNEPVRKYQRGDDGDVPRVRISHGNVVNIGHVLGSPGDRCAGEIRRVIDQPDHDIRGSDIGTECGLTAVGGGIRTYVSVAS